MTDDLVDGFVEINSHMSRHKEPVHKSNTNVQQAYEEMLQLTNNHRNQTETTWYNVVTLQSPESKNSWWEYKLALPS